MTVFPVEDRTETVRLVVALALVVLAAIALIVAVGVAVGKVVPDIGGDDIVEADDDTRTYPDADALMAAIGCTDSQPFSAFEGISTRIRSYAQPSGSQCLTDGTFALVYVDRDDRRVAEDDNDVRDRACATVSPADDAAATTLVPTTVAATTDPAATAATAAPTTLPPTTTAPTETTFGFVRGPNWILATAAGEDAANALNTSLGGVVFTKTCEPPTE